MENVLIVEDQRLMQRHFQNVLMETKIYKIAGVISDAYEAIHFCRKNKVDIVLMDLLTEHNHNGLTAARVIKELHPSIKVIVTTGLVDPELLEKSRQIADGFWYKNHSNSSLTEVMEKILNGEKFFPNSAPSVEFNGVDSSVISPRQLKMLRYHIKGYSYGEIADKMKCSAEGVRWNLKDMVQKTGFEKKEDLVAAALESKLIVTTLRDDV